MFAARIKVNLIIQDIVIISTVGKSFLVKVLIEAIKYSKIRAGLELDKPLVLIMAPTAVAAWLIGELS